MARIKPQSAKGKGRRLQQWVCARISEITGFPWGSSGEDHPIESRPMGQSGTDVRMESHVLELFPFSIECKAQETWNVHEYIKQAKTNILKNTSWLLIIKKSRQNPIGIMDGWMFEAWLEMKQKSLDTHHVRHFYNGGWSVEKWIKRTKSKADNFNKPNWLVYFGESNKEYVAFDAMTFFRMFGIAPMKRTK